MSSFMRMALLRAYNRQLDIELDGNTKRCPANKAVIADAILRMDEMGMTSEPIYSTTLIVKYPGGLGSVWAFRAGWLGRRGYLLTSDDELRVFWTVAGNGTQIYEVKVSGGFVDTPTTEEQNFAVFIAKSVLRAAIAGR